MNRRFAVVWESGLSFPLRLHCLLCRFAPEFSFCCLGAEGTRDRRERCSTSLSSRWSSSAVQLLPRRAVILLRHQIFRRRLIITCFSEIPSFLDLAWTASSERLSSDAISRELKPATANDRNFASSVPVQVGVPTAGGFIASSSPSARVRPAWLRSENRRCETPDPCLSLWQRTRYRCRSVWAETQAWSSRPLRIQSTGLRGTHRTREPGKHWH
jgi:hypothetical protein